MKASQLSDAEKAFIWQQSDEGDPVAGICRKAYIRGEKVRGKYQRPKLEFGLA